MSSFLCGIDMLGAAPSLFVVRTNADVRAEMDSVKTIITQLNNEIMSPGRANLPESFRASWFTFFVEFNQWYGNNYDNWITGNAQYEKAVEYRQQALAWRDQLEKYGPVAGPRPADDPGPKGEGWQIPWWVWPVVGGGALLLVAGPLVMPLAVAAIQARSRR